MMKGNGPDSRMSTDEGVHANDHGATEMFQHEVLTFSKYNKWYTHRTQDSGMVVAVLASRSGNIFGGSSDVGSTPMCWC